MTDDARYNLMLILMLILLMLMLLMLIRRVGCYYSCQLGNSKLCPPNLHGAMNLGADH